MSVDEWANLLQNEVTARPYFLRLEVIDQTLSILKARLIITQRLFVQVYRNDRYDTTNLALIHNERRIYARDKLGGRWHRHSVEASEFHDRSTEGQRPVELHEFLDEIEDILASRDLP
jgi:hypothetical protein